MIRFLVRTSQKWPSSVQLIKKHIMSVCPHYWWFNFYFLIKVVPATSLQIKSSIFSLQLISILWRDTLKLGKYPLSPHFLIWCFQMVISQFQHSLHIDWLAFYSEGLPVVAQTLKNPLAMQEAQGRFLGQEDPLEERAAHCSIPAWRSHGQRSLAGCSPRGRVRVGKDWAANRHTHSTLRSFPSLCPPLPPSTSPSQWDSSITLLWWLESGTFTVYVCAPSVQVWAWDRLQASLHGLFLVFPSFLPLSLIFLPIFG